MPRQHALDETDEPWAVTWPTTSTKSLTRQKLRSLQEVSRRHSALHPSARLPAAKTPDTPAAARTNIAHVDKSSGEELVRSENGGMNLFFKVFFKNFLTLSAPPPLPNQSLPPPEQAIAGRRVAVSRRLGRLGGMFSSLDKTWKFSRKCLPRAVRDPYSCPDGVVAVMGKKLSIAKTASPTIARRSL